MRCAACVGSGASDTQQLLQAADQSGSKHAHSLGVMLAARDCKHVAYMELPQHRDMDWGLVGYMLLQSGLHLVIGSRLQCSNACSQTPGWFFSVNIRKHQWLALKL